MVNKRASRREVLKTLSISLNALNVDANAATRDALIQEIADLEIGIVNIENKFLMAHRAEGAGSFTTHKLWGNKQRTVLDLPHQGGRLELHNKINPATNKEQGLGEGGLGYGRFGKLGGETTFVKKQRLKKNEQTAARVQNRPLYEQPADMQQAQLGYIEEEMDKFRRELAVTTNRLNHVNVIKSYGGAIGIGKDGMPKAYMVMDMMTGGDLKKVITAGTANDQRKKRIMKGALEGLAHVHAARMIHRDIKPDNIMLDAHDRVKLIDFGEAVDMDVNGEYRTMTKAGTAGYYHPIKIVQNEALRQQMIYDVSTDLYALQKTFEQLAPHDGNLLAWINTFGAVGSASLLSQNLDLIAIV